MNLDRFVAARAPEWDELEALLARAQGHPEQLGPEQARRLGELYRAAAADLSAVRATAPGSAPALRLEPLVLSARQAVYGTTRRFGSIAAFLSRDYWRLVAGRPRPLMIAIVALFGAAALGGLWALTDPAGSLGIVPEQFRSVVSEGTAERGGPTLDESAGFAGAIGANNIQVTLLAFAAGIVAGLGTVAVLAYNGLFLGVLTALVFEAGQGTEFVVLVAPHGVLELSCICVAGAAGMRFGWALVEPGERPRREALPEEARAAIAIVLGTAPWLIVAALVEGFVTPQQLPLPAALAVGFGLGAVYWWLVLWRGRRPVQQPIAQTRARALAVR